MHTDIDLKRMRYVMEVARAGAISLAAEHLQLTQSALSRSIVECEAAIAAQLFVRVPKGIRLTEAGQRFVDRAQRVLAEVDSLVRHVQAPGELLGGRLRVGFAPGGFVDHGARALCDFAEQYPQVGIDVSQGTAQVLCPRLLGGELDVLVSSTNYIERWSQLESRILAPMHFACLVRFGHPLAVAEAPIQERDVLQYPFVLPYSVEPGHTEVAKRCIANGLPPTMPHYAVDDITLIMRIVRNSNAVFPMLTPRPDFGGSAEHGVLLRDALHYPPRSIVIAYARGQPRSTAAERFEQLLRAQLARLQ